MTPAEIITEIEQAGGTVWAEGGKVKFRGTPARLIPHIRAQKAQLLALLSTPAPDNYAIEERQAIQQEHLLPPDRGFDDITGFEGMPDLALAEHGAILHRLMNPAQESPAPAKSTTDAIVTPTMQHRPAMAPSCASCGTCLRFLPGQPMPGQSLGTCSLTGAGPPSVEHGDYAACFPMASRRCSNHEGIES